MSLRFGFCFLILLLTKVSLAQNFNGVKTCVLNYEREGHPYTKTLQKIFTGNTNVILINEALPIDFAKCVQGGVEEILILVHALEIQGENETRIRLGYYLKDTSQEPAQYQIKPFLQRPFEISREWLAAEKISGRPTSLKSIRFLGCMADEVIAQYPELQALIAENSILLETAPKQNAMSWLLKKNVAVLDKKWAEESAQFEGAGSDGFYAYMKIKTVGVYSWGEDTVLRGQYRIKVKGVAVGFSSKSTGVYIKYSDLADMKVGEKRHVVLPELSVAGALWVNGEVQLGRHPKVSGTSEVNSLGVSVGLLKNLEIEKLY